MHPGCKCTIIAETGSFESVHHMYSDMSVWIKLNKIKPDPNLYGLVNYYDLLSRYDEFARYNMLQCRITKVVNKSAHIVNERHRINKWVNIKSIYVPSSQILESFMES